MDDLQQFSNPFSGILTPQALAALRAAQFQQQLNGAASPYLSGRDFAARTAGLNFGRDLATVGGPPNTPLDQAANQNQQILQDNSSAPVPTGDMYTDRANTLLAKAAQFQQAGRPDIAMRLQSAAMEARQAGLGAQREQSQVALDQGKLAELQAGAQYVVVDPSPDSAGIPQYKRYGDPISLYGDNGQVDPNFATNYRAAIADAKKAGADAPQLMRIDQLENSKAAVAAIRANAQALKAANSQNSDLDQDTIDQYTGAYAVNGMSALSRQPASTRNAVMKNLAAKGLTIADVTEAQIQRAALAHAVNTGATRAGTVEFLSNELPGLGQAVTDALQGVDRTRIQALNQAIAAGKTSFGDPAETRYAVAIQGLRTSYARLISGATGTTTDTARDEADRLLNTAQSPDQMRAAVDQIVNRELQVARQAGEGVIEMARNSGRYSALAKVYGKLGIPISSGDGGDTAQPLGSVAAQPSGNVTATGPNGQKLILVNGQWQAAKAGPSGGGASGSY